MRQLHSVRARLTLWNVAGLALTLLALGTVLHFTLQTRLLALVDWDLADRAHFTARRWTHRRPDGFGPPGGPRRDFDFHNSPPPRPRPDDRPPSGAPRFGDGRIPGGPDGRPGPDAPPGAPRAFDAQGRSLFPGSADTPWDAAALARTAQSRRERFTTVAAGGVTRRVFSLPLARDGQLAGVLQAAEPLDGVERDLRGVSTTLLALVPLCLLIAGAGGAFLTHRALVPVRRLGEAAGRIGADDLAQRLPLAGDDEFTALAATINGMLGRLQEAFEQQRRFTADASHELRSPLTVIRGYAGMALARPRSPEADGRDLERIDAAARRMDKVIGDLLLLARSDAGQLEMECRPVPLADALAAARDAVASPDRAPVDLDSVPAGLCALGDAEALIRLFVSLLDNAVRYSPPDAAVRVSYATGETTVTVTVADRGPGIAPEHLPHVCERFFRADPARTRSGDSTGLGLAIAQSIAEAHGGTLTLQSAPSAGTQAVVTLPREKNT